MVDGDTDSELMTGGVLSAGVDTGDIRNVRRTPFRRPSPAICPDALIAFADVSTHPDPAGRSVLRSVEPAASAMNACDELSARKYSPTTMPPEIDSAKLDVDPGNESRFTRPAADERKARWTPPSDA